MDRTKIIDVNDDDHDDDEDEELIDQISEGLGEIVQKMQVLNNNVKDILKASDEIENLCISWQILLERKPKMSKE